MNYFVLMFIGIVACGLCVVGLNIYNGLVSLRNQLERAWANIDVILKQRHDEIPQLIQVIEQNAHYEGSILTNLAEARRHYGAAESVSEKIQASNEMAFALKGVLALSENYPELKTNANFMQLQDRVSNLEDQLSDRRETYNETVANFNTRLDQFPDLVLARLLKYQRQTMFKVLETEKAIHSLKMNLPKFGKSA